MGSLPLMMWRIRDCSCLTIKCFSYPVHFLKSTLTYPSGIAINWFWTIPQKDAEVEEDVVNVNVPDASKQTCCSNVDFKVFNYKLLKKPQFLEIMFSFLVLGFGVATTFSFTVVCINILTLSNCQYFCHQDRAISFGIDSASASWILSCIGITNCLGRIVCGNIVDVFLVKFGEEHVTLVSAFILLINGLGNWICSWKSRDALDVIVKVFNCSSYSESTFPWLNWPNHLWCTLGFLLWRLPVKHSGHFEETVWRSRLCLGNNAHLCCNILILWTYSIR